MSRHAPRKARLPKKKRKKAVAPRAKGIRDDEERFRVLFSLGNLRKTWNAVRKEARSHRVRDVIDWMDWAIAIDATLFHIRQSIIAGSYIPSQPSRYELAKSHGSYRTITIPNIRDAIVYRRVSDAALELAMPSKVSGAFFSRRWSQTPVGKTLDLKDDPYLRFFDIWRRFNEYRTRTMLLRPYEILVVTDITNYFDSISHQLLLEYLAPLGLARKAIGLLGRLLETLKPSAGHSPNPGIGIPVDEYDCSRQLAHVFLFEHDRRVVQRVGEDNYVRWMDDQNIGAESMAKARSIVNALTRSLSSQRLTLNAGKTGFLPPEEVTTCFQLDLNKAISDWEDQYHAKLPAKKAEARVALKALWASASKSPVAGKGHWDKILKRLYAMAAKVDSSLLDSRMYDDLVEYPHLDERIFVSLARRNEGRKLADLFDKYRGEGECLFEATEAAFFEACLLLDASPALEGRVRKLARTFARGAAKGQSGRPYGKASAVLCLYWLGASATSLAKLFFAEDARGLPPSVARAWLACVAAKNADLLPAVQAKLTGHPSLEVARMTCFLSDLLDGAIDQVGSYKNQRPRWPKKGKFYDARAWLQLELTSQAGSAKLGATAKADCKVFARLARTRQEKRRLRQIRANII